jgi:ribosomal protein S18 acetylase RimI-like enzyme
MEGLTIRVFEERHIGWAEVLIGHEFGGRLQARLGSVVDALGCSGLVAELDAKPVGLVTFQQDGSDVEIVYLETTLRRRGIATALIQSMTDATKAERVWVVTTNDNLDALRFYQRRGFRLVAVRPGAVDHARRTLKRTIPSTGFFGIPVRDEIVLEWLPSRPILRSGRSGSEANVR